MKRPVFVIGIVFFLTTWLAFLLPVTLALPVSLAAALTGLALLLLGDNRMKSPVGQKINPKSPTALSTDRANQVDPASHWSQLPALVCLTAAVALGSYYLYHVQRVVPFDTVDGQELTVQGILLESTVYSNSASYLMLADFPDNPELPQKQYVSIHSYERMEYLEGDTLRCVISAALPAVSNRENYYRSKGIVLLGRLQMQNPVESVSSTRYALQSIWIRLRSGMKANLQHNLTAENAQVVGAMTLGLKGDIDPLIYDAVSQSGTAHLLSVSGLHLSIITAFLLSLMRLLRLPRLLRYTLVILFAFGFAVMVGFSGSIIRAFIMTAMMLLSRMISRNNDSRNALGMALLIICIIWPHWTQSRGLWLSAGSTLGILLFASTTTQILFDALRIKEKDKSTRLLDPLVRAMAVSISAYVFSLPILLISAGWFSLFSPLANMLITPFTAPVILGGVLCAFFNSNPFIMVVAAITDFCISMILGISRFVAELPFSTFSLDQGYLLILFVGVIAGAIVLFIFKADRKLVGFALMLCVFCAGVGHVSLLGANRDKLELVTLGGSDTTLLLRGDQVALIGAPTKYDIGLLLKYLRFRGINTVNAVVAPLYQNQIDSGLLRLSENYPIECMIAPNDAYILSMLQSALPDISILPSGGAHVFVLDAAQISHDNESGDTQLWIGKNTVLKIDQTYVIMESEYPDKIANTETIYIYRDGELHTPKRLDPLFEPVGRMLFEENRVILPLS